MSKLHIANTFFEWELENQPRCSLTEAFHQHPIFTQLQFLSVLYAGADEGALLADEPEASYWEELEIKAPKTFLVSEKDFSPFTEIESWGPSQLVASFARKHGLIYAMPEWKVVRQVNSKQFSFECSPKLPHAVLLENWEHAEEWLKSFEGKKVLKTCYGVSGKGHLIIDTPDFPREKIRAFLYKEWKKELPVIAEPWVERILDFSTQWVIGQDKRIELVGSTVCVNDDRGHYRYNRVGEEKTLFGPHLHFLKEHIQVVEPILGTIAALGYFGNIGIDAMVYNDQLHPVVEINARKTMGWVALVLHERLCPGEIMQSSYSPGTEGYLPKALHGKKPFSHNLTCKNVL